MEVLEVGIEHNSGNREKVIYGWVKLSCEGFKAKNTRHEAKDPQVVPEASFEAVSSNSLGR